MIAAVWISVLALIATANGQPCFCDWKCSLSRDCCLGCQEGTYISAPIAHVHVCERAVEAERELRNGDGGRREGRDRDA